MGEMSPGTALRNIQQAHAGLKKARAVLRLAKGDPGADRRVLVAGWTALAQAHRILAAIPLEAAADDVMTKQIAAQRYATALLVRLRRLARGGQATTEGDEDEGDTNEEG
jgi:CheY-like chemotaxis protein